MQTVERFFWGEIIKILRRHLLLLWKRLIVILKEAEWRIELRTAPRHPLLEALRIKRLLLP